MTLNATHALDGAPPLKQLITASGARCSDAFTRQACNTYSCVHLLLGRSAEDVHGASCPRWQRAVRKSCLKSKDPQHALRMPWTMSRFVIVSPSVFPSRSQPTARSANARRAAFARALPRTSTTLESRCASRGASPITLRIIVNYMRSVLSQITSSHPIAACACP